MGVDYQTIDIGFLYRQPEGYQVGLMVKNSVDLSETGHSTSGIHENTDFSLPTYVTLGASGRYHRILFSLDNEFIFGHYGGTGSEKARFWFIRAGVEKQIASRYALRAGLVIPAIAHTSSLGDIRDDIPWPKAGGALGFGARFGRFTFDAAVYGDPAKSYIDQDIRVKAVGSVSVQL